MDGGMNGAQLICCDGTLNPGASGTDPNGPDDVDIRREQSATQTESPTHKTQTELRLGAKFNLERAAEIRSAPD